MPELVTPPRGTRPRNRRALILAAAAQLFAENGYDQVSVGDIATAVGIGPSALYRHFSGKQELLREVVSAGIAPIRDLVADVDLHQPGPALRRLAGAALDGRHLGVLWQRESRHLAEPARAAALSDLRVVYKGLTTRISAARPDLNAPAAGALAATMASVLGSPSFHHVHLARPAFDGLLADMARTVLETPLPTDFPAPIPPGPPTTLRFASRREALLAEAIRMFSAYGYAAVGNECRQLGDSGVRRHDRRPELGGSRPPLTQLPDRLRRDLRRIGAAEPAGHALEHPARQQHHASFRTDAGFVTPQQGGKVLGRGRDQLAPPRRKGKYPCSGFTTMRYKFLWYYSSFKPQ